MEQAWKNRILGIFRTKSLLNIMSSAIAKKFIPLLDRVLVQKVKQEAKTASGIFLPEQAKQVINQATVIAVGEGRILKDGQKIACNVKPGDSVIVPEFGGMTLKLDDEEYQVFRNEDIVGIMKSD
jgi:co-chaperonin GroES (HSP10)